MNRIIFFLITIVFLLKNSCILSVFAHHNFWQMPKNFAEVVVNSPRSRLSMRALEDLFTDSRICGLEPNECIHLGDMKLVYKGEKREADRIYAANKIRKIITEYEFSRVKSPQYYVYANGGYFFVFAEYVHGRPATNITIEEIRELAFIVVQTGYYDFNDYGNLLRDGGDNKLVFVDTEKGSFCKTLSRIELLENLLNLPVTKEAEGWLINAIDSINKDPHANIFFD